MDVCWVIAALLAPGGTAYIVSKVMTLHVHIFSAQTITYFQAEIFQPGHKI